MEYLKDLWYKYEKHGVMVLIALCLLLFMVIGVVKCSRGGESQVQPQTEIIEDHMVKYPGRTFSYKDKFNDLQSRQHAVASQIGLPRPPKDRDDAASMKKKLREIKTNRNYIVDSLTHSVPYLIPSAARELDSIGAEWADILARNGLPHYRFYVTSVLRTEEDIRAILSHGYSICTDVEPISNMEKSLFTVDELTGIVQAAARMRPNGITDMEVKSFMKKWKDKRFAAKCNRPLILKGCEMLGMEIRDVAAIVIDGMKAHAEELQLDGKA